MGGASDEYDASTGTKKGRARHMFGNLKQRAALKFQKSGGRTSASSRLSYFPQTGWWSALKPQGSRFVWKPCLSLARTEPWDIPSTDWPWGTQKYAAR